MPVKSDPNYICQTPSDCGPDQHRTLGPHRSWCHQCGEYCYPRVEAACSGCMLPYIRSVMSEAIAAWDDVVAMFPTEGPVIYPDWYTKMKDLL